MTRKIAALCLALAAASFFVDDAFAAKYKDLTGLWTGAISCVGWNQTTGYYTIAGPTGFEIIDEDLSNGNFSGIFGSQQFTGNIAANKTVTAIAHGDYASEFRIFTLKLTGKKLVGTWNHYKLDQVDTCKLEFTRPQ
jgi:hypothetical protein